MSKNEDCKKKSGVRKNQFQGMNMNIVSNMRIIQRHLVYVIGLSSNLANKDVLIKQEYFAQYGTVLKIVVNKTKAYDPNGPNGPSYSAYISYSTYQEASIAILAIDNIEVDGHLLRASFGTTKYCTFFLKNCDCPNKDCLYLHYLAADEDIIHRDDISTSKNIFYEQQLLAIKMAELYKPEVKRRLTSSNQNKNKLNYVLPQPDSIYYKSVVIENDPTGNCLELGRKNYSENFNYYNSGSGSSSSYSSYSAHTKHPKKRYEYDDYNYNSNSNQENINNNKFNSPQSNSNTAASNYNNDEVEYVLVRETPYTRKQNKKKMSFNPIMCKKNAINENENETKFDLNYNNELLFTSNSDNCQTESMSGGEGNASTEKMKEEFKKDINVNFIKIEENFTTDNIEENIFDNETETEKKFYRQRKISRFDFVNANNNGSNKKSLQDDNISEDTKCSHTEVPDFISEMLYKKMSTYTFFKKFTCVKDKNNDIEYFEKELKNNNNSWAQFIKSNLYNSNGNEEKLGNISS